MKITIIGAGNMGGAIALGFANGKTIRPEDITCVDPNPAALDKLRKAKSQLVLTGEMRRSIPDADILVLAVKFTVIEEVIAQIRDIIDFRRQIIFSIVAGVTFEQLNAFFFGTSRSIDPILFRVMPNTAIQAMQSMTFIAEHNATNAQTKLVQALFSEMGKTMIIPERLMDQGMAIGSCGTAFIMRLIRAMMMGGVEIGFNSEQSLKVVLQTIRGALELLEITGKHPEEEIDRITTPGGFTIRGLNAMESKGFTDSVISGIRVACKKPAL